VAPSYGDAELRLGPWLEKLRDKLFVGCKTGERNRDEAYQEMRRSLERLRVDALDLYQLHAVTSLEELDAVTASGGALEALVQAQEEGLTRYLGITSHGMQAPVVLQEALARFDFDTILFPINFVLYGDTEYRRNTEELLATCSDRDVGTMIIKSIARRPWGDGKRIYTCWYEPFDEQEMIDRAVWFVLSQPITGLPHVGDLSLMPRVLDAAERFVPLGSEELEAIIAEAPKYELIFET
jgi:predicted aldo/keto reductase-like oxidoreductase